MPREQGPHSRAEGEYRAPSTSRTSRKRVPNALDSLAETRRALRRGAVHLARSEFARFSDRLDAQFALEDELYFPAVTAGRPDLAARLAEIVRHREFIECAVPRIQALLRSGEADLSADHLDELANRLARYDTEARTIIPRA